MQPRLGTTVAVVAIGSILWGTLPLFGTNGLTRRLQMRADLAALEAEAASLQAKTRLMERRLHGLIHQPLVQEQVVRDRLGWVGGNDLVLHLTP